MNVLLNVTNASEGLGDILPLWSILPFVVMLLASPSCPSRAGWCGTQRNKAIVAAPRGAGARLRPRRRGSTGPRGLISTGKEYISFIILLARSSSSRAASSSPATPWARRGTTPSSWASAPCWPLHRHDRRRDGAHPAAPARQRGGSTRCTSHLLHLHRLQHRRPAHAARRPAALPRLPARACPSPGRCASGRGGPCAGQPRSARLLLRSDGLFRKEAPPPSRELDEEMPRADPIDGKINILFLLGGS